MTPLRLMTFAAAIVSLALKRDICEDFAINLQKIILRFPQHALIQALN